MHCVPASSASSERTFSVTGQVYNKKRPRLSPSRMEQLTIINLNYDIVQHFKASHKITPAACNASKFIVVEVNEDTTDIENDESELVGRSYESDSENELEMED